MKPPAAGGFVGRRLELTALCEALERALSGHGTFAVFSGEAGIGKTRLAEEVSAHARRAHADVFWGQAWEGDGAPALWPWVQILRAWIEGREPDELRTELGTSGGAIAHLVPEVLEKVPDLEVPALDEGERGRFRLLDVVATVLRRVSRTRALVLVLDDVQWADESSLELLRMVARQAPSAAILLLATLRESEIPSDANGRLLASLAREGASSVLRGLPADNVRELVAQTFGADPSPGLVTALLERTDGNPLFVREIARLLAEDDSLETPSTHAAWMQQIPAGIQQTIRRRFDRLPPGCAAVLARAAVLGREFELRVLERMPSSPSDPTATDAIDAAVAARLVSVTPGAPGHHRFAHALLRETLYADLRASEQVSLHLAAGRALEEIHRDDLSPHLAELAQHFLAAAGGGDCEPALRYSVAAARRATELRAYEEAARLYEQALAVLSVGATRSGDAVTRRRVDLMLALADARSMASDDARAHASYLEVAELADGLGLAEPLARAALWAGGRGDMTGLPEPRLIALLERALAALGRRDVTRRSQLQSRLSGALTLVPGTRARRMQLTEEAVAAAETAADPDTLALALVARHLVLCGPGRLAERLAIGERLLALAQGNGSRESQAMALLWHGKALLEACEVEKADQAMQQFAALSDELRQPSYQVHVRGWRAMRALLDGRLTEAESLIAAMLSAGAHADAVNTQFRYVTQMFALRREQGRLAELAPTILGVVAVTPAIPSLRGGAAVAALEAGREGEARAHFEFLARDDFANLPHDFTWPGAVAQLAQVCVALGDAPRAAVLYDLLLPDAERNLVIGFTEACEGCASRFLGMLAALQGKDGEAARHFEVALAMNARMGARPALAHTQREFASLLLRRGADGDRGRAESLVAEALRTYTEVGMMGFAERGTALARSAVERRASAPNVLRRDGDAWLIGFGSVPFRMRDSKGLRYIARLLASPERELNVVDLAGVADVRQTDASPVPDERARLAYRRRLDDLRGELDEAERFGDLGRSAALRRELDAVASELAIAFGLRGARGRVGNERVRKAVTKCIRDQITRIARVDESLGRHLANAIQTGTFCAYAPESPVPWELSGPE